jgi:hypothetical protein
MSSSRFVRIAMHSGKNLAINMRNVLSVEQQGLNVIVNYNATHPNGAGFLIVGTGFHLGGGTTVKDEFVYACEKDAKFAFEKLTSELA